MDTFARMLEAAVDYGAEEFGLQDEVAEVGGVDADVVPPMSKDRLAQPGDRRGGGYRQSVAWITSNEFKLGLSSYSIRKLSRLALIMPQTRATQLRGRTTSQDQVKSFPEKGTKLKFFELDNRERLPRRFRVASDCPQTKSRGICPNHRQYEAEKSRSSKEAISPSLLSADRKHTILSLQPPAGGDDSLLCVFGIVFGGVDGLLFLVVDEISVFCGHGRRLKDWLAS